jgi:hypothetical protein
MPSALVMSCREKKVIFGKNENRGQEQEQQGPDDAAAIGDQGFKTSTVDGKSVCTFVAHKT